VVIKMAKRAKFPRRRKHMVQKVVIDKGWVFDAAGA